MLNSTDYKSFKSIFSTLTTLKQWHALRTHGIRQLGWMESRRLGISVDSSGPIPWWPYSAIHYLDQVVPTNYSVLEFGGGSSTIWWLSRGNKVTTVETDIAWVDNLKAQVQSKGLEGSWKVHHASEINALNVGNVLNGETFDVVVNDGLGDRNLVVELLNKYVREQGVVIWDNSDRSEYSDSLVEFQAEKWKKLEFFGLSPINAYCSQTSVFMQTTLGPIGRNPKLDIIQY